MFKENPLRVYSPDLKLLGEFGSICQAVKKLGVSNSGVSRCCRRESPTYLGLIWRYICDDEFFSPEKIMETDIDYLRMLCKTTQFGRPRGGIRQYTMSGEFLTEYRDAAIAETSSGTPRGSVLQCCKGASVSAGGFIWRYANDDEAIQSAKVSAIAAGIETVSETVEDGEVWRRITNWDKYDAGYYEISNLGRVRRAGYRENSGRYKAPRIINGVSSPNGLLRVSLSNGAGGLRIFYIHKLVAMHFIPNPKNYRRVTHLDNNPINNRADNLKWCGPADIPTVFGSGNNPEHKSIPVRQYSPYGELVKEYKSAVVAGKELGIYSGSIYQSCNRRFKSPFSHGFAWRYVTDDELYDLSVEERFNRLCGRVVLQYTRDGVFVKRHPTLSFAKAEIGDQYRGVYSCCVHRCKTYKGYIWQYADDDRIGGS